MENLNNLWEKALDMISSEINETSFETWIEPIKPISLDEQRGFIYFAIIDQEIVKNTIESRYYSVIEKALEEVYGSSLKSFYKLYSEEEYRKKYINKDEKNTLSKGTSVEEDYFYLNPKYTFNSFVVGNNNQFARAASLAVAETPANAFNPLFLYGGAGLGKTHLMHAIANFIIERNKKAKVLYVSSEIFTNEFIDAIGKNKNDEFRNKYRSIDVLLIDDIQFIEKKERTQEEIFHTFNTLHEANKQIVICSDRPPKALITLEERLRSRFEWGLTVDIQPPDFETRVAIMLKKAEEEKIEINNSTLEVIEFIAEKVKTNIRELEGAFIRVVAFSTLTHQTINKDIAKEVLKDIITENTNVTPQTIKENICSHFDIKMADLESSRRSRNLAFPRQIAMYICRELTDLSLPKIGSFFGNRDHTTVLHACDKISTEIKTNKDLNDIIDGIMEDIKCE